MDWIIHDELGLTVRHVVSYAAASAMVIGGIIPYVPQYREIKQTQDAEGFSLHVCFALLIANTLRILFWFYKNYELPLLVQSVIMNITMFLMINLCVKVRRNNALLKIKDRVFTEEIRSVSSPKSINPVITSELVGVATERTAASTTSERQRVGSQSSNSAAAGARGSSADDVAIAAGKKPRHYLSDFDRRYFWQWTDFQSYLDFMLIVWAVGAVVTYLMLGQDWFMETMGFLAVFVEAMLGAPQFARNIKNKSTFGMSIHMVVMWTIGDMFKTGYYFMREAPMQFWICGILQCSLDYAILFQVWLYRKNTQPARGAAVHGD